MPRKKSEKTKIYCTAAFGDTLDRIARRLDIDLDILKQLNPDVKGPVYLLKLGQRVRIS